MQILFDNWTGRYDDECLMPGDIVEAAMVYNFRERRKPEGYYDPDERGRRHRRQSANL